MKPTDRIKQEIKRWEAKLFPRIEIKHEPRLIKLADNTPNPHGKIVPPNSPVTPGRKL